MAEQNMLVPLDTYLATGIHIGMRMKIKPMERYIYKIRQDKLAVFDIAKIDAQIRLAASFLSRYKPEDIMVVSRKRVGHKPVIKFAELTGSKVVFGRFMPGTLTNPNYENYTEPKVLVVTDPFADRQAVVEAYKANIPVVGLCGTYNETRYLDLIVPLNNKGRKSVALLYWILARELLKAWGKIKSDDEMKVKPEDFEMPPEAGIEEEGEGEGDVRFERPGRIERGEREERTSGRFGRSEGGDRFGGRGRPRRSGA